MYLAYNAPHSPLQATKADYDALPQIGNHSLRVYAAMIRNLDRNVGRVLDASGRPIEGLYAVGNDRASVMGGNYPGAGITLGPIMTFGYITGRHLAGIEPARPSQPQVEQAHTIPA
jgi:hypothetical protein